MSPRLSTASTRADFRQASYRAGWWTAISVSRVANALSGGNFREPLCARIGRNVYTMERPLWAWRSLAAAIDFVFFFDRQHCFRSFIRYSTRQEA